MPRHLRRFHAPDFCLCLDIIILLLDQCRYLEHFGFGLDTYRSRESLRAEEDNPEKGLHERPSIKSVELRLFTFDDERILGDVLDMFSEVRTFKLFPGPRTAYISTLHLPWNHLESLEIQGIPCREIILFAPSRLRSLTLAGSFEYLTRLSQYNNLRHLTLRHIANPRDLDLIALSVLGSRLSLESFTFEGRFLYAYELRAFIERAPLVSYVSLPNMSYSMFPFLTALPALGRIDLFCCRLESLERLMEIIGDKPLREIRVSRPLMVPERVMKMCHERGVILRGVEEWSL
jgi:hypothetical protein